MSHAQSCLRHTLLENYSFYSSREKVTGILLSVLQIIEHFYLIKCTKLLKLTHFFYLSTVFN